MRILIIFMAIILSASMAHGGGCPNSSPICAEINQPLTITNTGTSDSFTVNDEAGDTSPFVIDENGNIGIGTTNPSAALHVAGTASTDIGKFDVGIDFNFVTNTVAPSLALINSAGNVDAGEHYYYTTFYSALGETNMTGYTKVSITTDASNGQVTVTVPVSSDSRVVGRKIYRSTAGSIYYQNVKLLVDIADNTTTTYVDNIADADLTGTNYYFQENLTNKFITVNDTQAVLLSTINTIMGVDAGKTITNGTALSSSNTLIGTNVGKNITTGVSMTGVGRDALRNVTSGSSNTGIGYGALYSINEAIGSTAIGRNTGYYNQTGDNNTYLGFYAGFGVSGNSNSNNTFISYYSGRYITTGSNNIFLGYSTGDNVTTGSNNIVIGYNTEAPAADSANTLSIGNLIFGTGIDGEGTTISSGNIGIGIIPTEKLQISGNIFLTTDNDKIKLGTGKNAEVSYNGTNLIIDPNAVGSGKVYIGATGNDTINAGAYEVAGVAGLSATYTFGGGASGEIATMTFASGILTAVTTVP